MSIRFVAVLGILSFAVAGCAAESATSSKEEIGTYEGELKLATPKLLGPIASGETKSGYYYNPPKYRAYSFTAKAGDQITVDVKSIYGDAMGWITDANYNSLAANDDASNYTLNSKVTYKVPSSVTTPKAYRIVFRDYDLLDATFDVTLSIKSATPPPAACDPAAEPWRSYKGTPATCPIIRYTCAAGTRNFENACGCGCETF